MNSEAPVNQPIATVTRTAPNAVAVCCHQSELLRAIDERLHDSPGGMVGRMYCDINAAFVTVWNRLSMAITENGNEKGRNVVRRAAFRRGLIGC